MKILPVCLLVVLLAAFRATSRKNAGEAIIRVGHTGSAVTASLYVAQENDSILLVPFSGEDDVGYALMAGEIDAALMSPEKAALLLEAPAGRSMHVRGIYEYPFGATLAISSSLDIRLGDLPGTRLAVSSPVAEELHIFAEELHRYDIDIADIRFVVLPYETMVPALSSGTVDGALIRGSSMGPLAREGHQILFQKWDFEPGDDCCNITAQVEQVLLLAESAPFAPEFLPHHLSQGEALSPEKLRRVLAQQFPLLGDVDLPLAEFSPGESHALEQYIRHQGHGQRVEGVRFDDEFTGQARLTGHTATQRNTRGIHE